MAKKKISPLPAVASLPITQMVSLVEQLLALMHEVIAGKVEMEDVRYMRAFGSKEGLVPQLQRLCGVLKEAAALSGHAAEAQTAPEQIVRADADEEALISYYLQAIRAQKQISADEAG